MAQVVMGKLLPNLKVTLGDEDPDTLLEEGELSDVEEQKDEKIEDLKISVNVVRSWMPTLQGPKVYENKNGGFITGLDLSSDVLLKKLEDRAERFGLDKKENPITQTEIDALYKSLDIDQENVNGSKLKDMRLEALHMRGVEEMNTNDIFKYFAVYGAASVEWINDFSCNVVWLDKETTARALLGLSKPMDRKKKIILSDSPVRKSEITEKDLDEEIPTKMASDSEDSDDDDDDKRDTRYKKTETVMDVDAPAINDNSVDNSNDIGIPVPPGQWRLGLPHPKAKAILLRFATKDDKKIPGAEKRSHYYQKYGNPNYGGLRGLISKSKKKKIQAARNRQIVEDLGDDSKADTDLSKAADLCCDISSKPVGRPNVLKMPRMKMYADEVEEKSKATGFKHQNFEKKPGNIYSRLGPKYTKDDLFTLGKQLSSDSEEVDDNIAINCTIPSRYNIWTDIALDMARNDKPFKKDDSTGSESSDSCFRPIKDLRNSLNNKSTKSQKRTRSPESDSSDSLLRPTTDLRTSLNNRSSKILKRMESSDSDDSDSRFSRTKDLRTSLNSKSSRLSIKTGSSYKSARDFRTESSYKSSRDFRSEPSYKSSREFRTSRQSQRRSPQRMKSMVSSVHSRSEVKPKGDLRSKIKRLKEDDSPSKHRSPLCKDD